MFYQYDSNSNRQKQEPKDSSSEDWEEIERILLEDDEPDIDLSIGSDPYVSFKWP